MHVPFPGGNNETSSWFTGDLSCMHKLHIFLWAHPTCQTWVPSVNAARGYPETPAASQLASVRVQSGVKNRINDKSIFFHRSWILEDYKRWFDTFFDMAPELLPCRPMRTDMHLRHKFSIPFWISESPLTQWNRVPEALQSTLPSIERHLESKYNQLNLQQCLRIPRIYKNIKLHYLGSYFSIMPTICCSDSWQLLGTGVAAIWTMLWTSSKICCGNCNESS